MQSLRALPSPVRVQNPLPSNLRRHGARALPPSLRSSTVSQRRQVCQPHVPSVDSYNSIDPFDKLAREIDEKEKIGNLWYDVGTDKAKAGMNLPDLIKLPPDLKV